jgi:hypothetical protein
MIYHVSKLIGMGDVARELARLAVILGLVMVVVGLGQTIFRRKPANKA